MWSWWAVHCPGKGVKLCSMWLGAQTSRTSMNYWIVRKQFHIAQDGGENKPWRDWKVLWASKLKIIGKKWEGRKPGISAQPK